MKGHILTVVLVSVMAILSLPAEDHWTEAEPGGPLFASISPSDNQAVMLPTDETTTSDVNLHSSPVMFIENAGQWDDGARFQVWGGPAGTMWLAEDAIWITMLEQGQEEMGRLGTIPQGQVDKVADSRIGLSPGDREAAAPGRGVSIKLSFIDANPHPRIEAFKRLDTTISYFYGNDPDQWQPDVPVWGGVRYVDLYPGIDLELMGEDGQVALRLAAKVEANLAGVRLRLQGADDVVVEADHLRLTTAVDEIAFPLLQATERYNKAAVLSSGGQQFEVSIPFAVPPSVPPFSRAASNAPTDNPTALRYGTFLDGSGYSDNSRQDVALDTAGNTFVAGETFFSTFPTTPGAFDPTFDGYADIFVAKLNSAGDALVYGTYLGGQEYENGRSIAVDDAGCAYITGATNSADFPVTLDAFDTTYNGGPSLYGDAYVVKLNPEGTALAYATFLGGNSADNGRALIVNGTGSAIVTGETDSNDFPVTPNAFDTSFNGSYYRGDAFVAKLNLEGNALAYATFLGGADDDWGNAIALDQTGDLYVTGATISADFPVTAGAFSTIYGGGLCVPRWSRPCSDAFVAKLDHSGSMLLHATFLGGHGNDSSAAIAVDGPGGSIYVVGSTGSSNFPATPGAFDTTFGEGACGPGRDEYPCPDAFVARFDQTVSTLIYATFLGGGTLDYGEDGVLAGDGTGNIYVAGTTWSDDFPATPNAFDATMNGGLDAFVARLDPTGAVLAYATFLGGSQNDGGRAITLDRAGVVHLTGPTSSPNFPTTPGAFDTSFDGNFSAFIVELMVSKNVYLPMLVAR